MNQSDRETELVRLLVEAGSPDSTDLEACAIRMERIVELSNYGWGAGRLSRATGTNKENMSRLIRRAKAKVIINATRRKIKDVKEGV